MGNIGEIESLALWKRKKLDSKQGSQITFDYYTREMKTGAACMKSYAAHVFVQRYQAQSEMESDWKNVNYHIAMHYQSKVKSIIEKSNFYICFFVPEKISVKIRKEIEGNSFCAKKYIFLDCNEPLHEKEILQEIENKIFGLNIPVTGDILPKIKKMQMQNFRAYSGNVTIDLCDSRKKAASFVVVYAKNGVGKTSLFDGVEYALKGEVERIISLIEKDKYNRHTGPIYHNRDHAEDDAFVSMELENGKIIKRKVGKIPEGGNDLRTITAEAGKEITGTKKEKDIWNQTILPHDKIDSFISAMSPMEQYKEWIGAAAPLKNETDEFQKAYHTCKESKKALKDLKDECEKISRKLKEISKEREAVDKFIQLIDLYNKMAAEDKRLYFSRERADVQQYDSIVNLAVKYSREVNRYKVVLEKNISLAQEMLDSGVEAYQEIIASIHEMEQELKRLNLQIQRKKELDALIQMNTSCRKQMDECRKELDILQEITEYGIERVNEYYKKLIRLEKEIDAQKRNQKAVEKSLQELLDDEKRAELKKRELENAILSTEDYQRVHKKAEDLDNVKAEIQEMKLKQNAAQQQWVQYQQSVRSIRELLSEAGSLVLPEKFSELTILCITKSSFFLNKEVQFRFFDLQKMYQNCEIKRALYQEELLKNNQSNQKLRDIQKLGIEYITVHKNISNCPLCHTVFDDWKTLFLNISNVQEDKDDLLHKKILQNQKKYELINKIYVLLQKKYRRLKQNYIETLKSELSQAMKNYDECLKEKEYYEKKKEWTENRLMDLKIWFIQKNIQLEEWSLAEIEIWRKKQGEELELCKTKWKKAVEQKENEQTKIAVLQEKIDELIEQKDEITNDIELYRYIEFYKNQPESYDIQIRLDEGKKQIQKLENEQKQRQVQIDQYQDVVASIDMETLTKSRDDQIKGLEKSKAIREKYKIFDDLSEEGVNKNLRNWEEEKSLWEQQDEYLKQISEESSARHYFENYQKCMIDLNNKKADYAKHEEKQSDVKAHYEDKKRKLEEGLQSYYSQLSMNEIFKKINPHDFMKNVKYHLSFNEKDEPQLNIYVSEANDEMSDEYRPEWYFSTAQLNTVAFSSFLSRALAADDLRLGTIFIDDPIGHFDDMNILGFTDLIRSIFERFDCQIIMSTHDEKIFRILERKLDDEYYSSCFIRLPESEAVIWKE